MYPNCKRVFTRERRLAKHIELEHQNDGIPLSKEIDQKVLDRINKAIEKVLRTTEEETEKDADTTIHYDQYVDFILSTIEEVQDLPQMTKSLLKKIKSQRKGPARNKHFLKLDCNLYEYWLDQGIFIMFNGKPFVPTRCNHAHNFTIEEDARPGVGWAL